MMRLILRTLPFFAAVFCAWSSAAAEVRLPHLFGDHMVLQRDSDLPVWGWSEADEEITVELSGGPAVTTTADADGAWRVDLGPRSAGGPFTLTVSGENTVVFEDVLIGEVWLCSGQSNMEWSVSASRDADEEAAAADWPQIRHIKVPLVPAGAPEQDFEGAWEVCTPETAGDFTAVGYYFGRHLHGELQVPIGLVNSTWGGTRIEPWTPPVGFAKVPALADIRAQVDLADPRSSAYKAALAGYMEALLAWVERAGAALEEERSLEQPPVYPEGLVPLASRSQPTGLYNGMIAPLVPFALRGAIWYQGESNHEEGRLYAEKKRALVEGWREVWGQEKLPFYYVQIAPFRYGDEDPSILPAFWEGQTAALDLPDTGMVVINDIADLNDIHPRNKQDVGRRLALLALNRTYGQEALVCSGPTFRELSLEGDRLRVHFDHVGGGLLSRDGESLTWFEILGPGSGFTPAEALIDGDSVLLSSPEAAAPCAVRFAWHRNAEPNLMNLEGWPAGPFRAGELPSADILTDLVPEAEEYELVYELDLADLGSEITYGVDRSEELDGSFDRIAYCLDLQKTGDAVQYVYVSMDAFTDDLRQIGIPTPESGAVFQTEVTRLNVFSNAKGIVTGTERTGGNIEFWPHNYASANAAGVPGASDDVYDFGDERVSPTDGYGCLQVHDREAGHTLLAINHWRDGDEADLGIGNSEGGTRDWTFTGNAGTYERKRLRVLVRLVER